MTEGDMLRAGLETGCPRPGSVAKGLGPMAGALASSWIPVTRQSPRGRVSFHTAAAVAILLALGACSQSPPPVTAAPRTPAVCEALRPAMPISYSSTRDTPETVKGVRQANARFTAACP